MGILEFLFSLFILTLPIGEIGRLQFGSVSISVNDIILLLTASVWFIRRVLKKQTLSFNYKLFKPVVIFILIGFTSLILNLRFLDNYSFLVSFLYLLRFGLYFLIYLIIFDLSKAFRNKVLYLLSFSSILIMLAGFIQLIFYPNLRNLYYLGWDEHLYRLFSTLLDPNFAGIILVLSFVLLFGLTIKFLRNKKNYKSIIFAVLVFINLYEVYLTYSRSALIMLFISVLIFLFLIGRKKITLFVLIALVLTVFFIPNSFKTEGTNFFRTASSNARLGSIKNGIEIFKNNPVLGVGFNAYRYAQHRYGYLTGNAWETTHAGAGLDNSFVFILATTGLIGLTSFFYIIYSIFNLASAKRKSINSIILISSISGLIIGSFFINSLFYVFVMEWIWILAGVTESS